MFYNYGAWLSKILLTGSIRT